MSEVTTNPSLHRRHVSGDVLRHRFAPVVARHTVLIIATVLFFGPFLWMLLTSFKSSAEALAFPPTFLPHTWRFGNFVDVFKVAPFGRYYLNSAIVATVTTIGQVLTSLMAGFAFARLKFRGRNLIFVILLAALLVPFEVVFTPLISLISSLGWMNSYQGLIVPNIPSILGAFLFRQFFANFSREIEDASRIDGAGVWRRLWLVMAPMASPMIGSFAVLSFVYNWNNFFFQFLVVTKPQVLHRSGRPHAVAVDERGHQLQRADGRIDPRGDSGVRGVPHFPEADRLGTGGRFALGDRGLVALHQINGSEIGCLP